MIVSVHEKEILLKDFNNPSYDKFAMVRDMIKHWKDSEEFIILFNEFYDIYDKVVRDKKNVVLYTEYTEVSQKCLTYVKALPTTVTIDIAATRSY